MPTAFEPPPYPYDRLDALKAGAAGVEGGLVDLSIGTPCDPMPPVVVWAMAESADAGIGYPPSIGTLGLRDAACGWMQRRLGVTVAPNQVTACVGTKEAVTSLPHLLRLRDPSRDTVLYPAVSYPSYEMGAVLAGCRAFAIPPDTAWHPDLDRVPDDVAARALVLWLNEPANPTGSVATAEWYARAVRWARDRGVIVASDECYAEFTGGHERTSALTTGHDGVLVLHSLSKRSNMAGMRVGFFAGDPDLVHYVAEVRKHAGLMIPGPIQAAAAVALADDDHVEAQLARYAERRALWMQWLDDSDLVHDGGPGTFYLWVRARDDDPAAEPNGDPSGPQASAAGPSGDGRRNGASPADARSDDPDAAAWRLAARFASGGTLVAPGDLYGEHHARHVRIALVQPLDRLELALERLASVRTG